MKITTKQIIKRLCKRIFNAKDLQTYGIIMSDMDSPRTALRFELNDLKKIKTANNYYYEFD